MIATRDLSSPPWFLCPSVGFGSKVAPDDYPSKLQAHHVAYKIACAILNNEV
jgi:hypothetical protein